jgi:hypothetical protein
MALVKGPLFSVSAHGTLSKTITFRSSARGTVARKYAKPSGLPSIAQSAIRSQTKTLMQLWPSLTLDQKNSWLPLAIRDSVSLINSFLKYNYYLLSIGQPTSDVYPPVSTPPTLKLYASPGYPLPNPDLTGVYTEIGTYNDELLFSRTDPFLSYLWYWEGTWFIGLEVVDDPSGSFFYLGSMTGLYSSFSSFSGRLLLSF